ncbi:hypothetical protein LUX33_10105 [Actinomadura madurae]|uniref:hypothetical protein n=1 Tax=Actinomadura madurae TaxID=1993 RepID=UPI0020D260D3|nr:hypothetical protein [Actinomadura madurae]MCP9948734.1 hypothetical protein [Actinomadura madurae]
MGDLGDLSLERVIAAAVVMVAAIAIAVVLRLLTGRLFRRAATPGGRGTTWPPASSGTWRCRSPCCSACGPRRRCWSCRAAPWT